MDEIELLLAEIKKALRGLVTLEITTSVGELNPPDTALPTPKTSAYTRIQLLQSNVFTNFHPDFVTGPYQSLRDYHAEREKAAMDLLHANIAVLQKLASFAVNELRPLLHLGAAKPADPAPPAPTDKPA